METDKPAASSEPAASGTGPATPETSPAPVPEAEQGAAAALDPAGLSAEAIPTLGDVLLAAEELWPESLAEGWDAVGLVAGRPDNRVERILFAVDPTSEVIDEALEWGADLLLTHHPLLLKPVHSVAATGFKGDAVHRLIEGKCALLTVHTNGDSAVGGVSDVLADAFGLSGVVPLSAAEDGLPEEGIGRVGELPEATTLADFARLVFSIMPAVAGGVRVAGDPEGLVRRVAVCGGAGDSLFDAVRRHQADVYVTADLRHHPASEAREAAVNDRPYLIDVSHFGSEWLWLTPAAAALENVLGDQGFTAEIRVSGTNTDPWDFVLTPGLN
ncbi:Nif3-like dinuclear metal center hexameric protein [Arthrobacter jiangjiafuii]|uniref:GTP cyclohydrolase 1 type 2 homolog n=1 Tax=Arthrobacter jiangjiafuii TaxID=2817475 RepID=A0A975M317_9MICC|nr:Nif3-like dinuclear metal center hexameric protein [Arthrobacter jiangjiafuii]MBP3043531.1 Nif3-like dinuclear metal center hexameric protein [Arthrobacter jiangjiafuii]QWC09046.1 Nif3-like dinuclear metal center hexameric protein [Arthrobacter jiangjiafuii]